MKFLGEICHESTKLVFLTWRRWIKWFNAISLPVNLSFRHVRVSIVKNLAIFVSCVPRSRDRQTQKE